MLDWIAFLCLCGAVAMLFTLSVTDLRTRLLPNEMVLGFATLGCIFHVTTVWRFVPLPLVLLGFVAGFGMLYIVRIIANRIYKTDALGLGDVKLMGAGGLWLGPDGIMLALTLGATAGLVHGLFQAFREAKATGAKPDLKRLQLPAGPGFAVGLILAGIHKFWTFNPFH